MAARHGQRDRPQRTHHVDGIRQREVDVLDASACLLESAHAALDQGRDFRVHARIAQRSAVGDAHAGDAVV